MDMDQAGYRKILSVTNAKLKRCHTTKTNTPLSVQTVMQLKTMATLNIALSRESVGAVGGAAWI